MGKNNHNLYISLKTWKKKKNSCFVKVSFKINWHISMVFGSCHMHFTLKFTASSFKIHCIFLCDAFVLQYNCNQELHFSSSLQPLDLEKSKWTQNSRTALCRHFLKVFRLKTYCLAEIWLRPRGDIPRAHINSALLRKLVLRSIKKRDRLIINFAKS